MASKIQSWDRQPGETDTRFAAFVCFRDLGSDRTLEQVSKKLEKSLALLGRWSTKHDWRDRAAAFDGHLDRIAQKVQEKNTGSRTEKWLRIREETLERKLDDAEMLVKQARYLASFPVHHEEQRTVQGLPVIIKPAKPDTIVAASRVMSIGYALKWEAITRALEINKITDTDASTTPTVSAEGLDEQRLSEIRRRLSEITAEQMAAVNFYLNTPPPGPLPSPIPDQGQ